MAERDRAHQPSAGPRTSLRSRHNQVYWRGDADYRAFGVGATSRLGGARWARPKGLAAYVAWVEAGACPPPAPPDPPEEVLLDEDALAG